MIKFEKPDCKLFLTFSAIIKNGDAAGAAKIVDLQNRVTGELLRINGTQKMAREMASDRTGLHGRVDGAEGFIYRYPEDRIHFSIANYGDFLLKINDFANFESARQEYQRTSDYKRQLRGMADFKERFYDSFPTQVGFQIKGFYLRPDKIIGKSIAMQAFPARAGFFDSVRGFLGPIKIRSHGEGAEEHCAINIFRFIDKNPKEIDDGGVLYDFLAEANNNLREEPVRILIKPEIVISDNYLSNQSSDIEPKA